MITLTKLNKVPFVLNCDLIENITENPDTTILLTTGTLYIVSESAHVVVEKVIAYKKMIYGNFLQSKIEISENSGNN